MNKFYVSFGQVHVHSVNGVTFDKDILAAINARTEQEARSIAFNTFGNKWFTTYTELPDLKWFPRGVAFIN